MSRLRRAVLAVLAVLLLAGCAPAPAQPPSTSTPAPDLAQLERQFDARLGVYAVDTGSERRIAYHADERFAYASTHKALSVSTLLRRRSLAELNKHVTYRRDDVVSHSPITKHHVDTGMSLRDVADAAIRYSDNTAANLIFREIGGPSGLNAELRRIGDTTTHADRIETALNRTKPGDPRDTSTPRALAGSLRAFTLGDALAPDRRALLSQLLRTNALTGTLMRAVVPDGWRVGDKSGSADFGTRNDIGVLWPPHRAPIVLTVLSHRHTANADSDDELIAQATERVIKALR